MAHIALSLLFLMISVCVSAQTAVKGRVIDATTGEPIVGAAVIQSGTTKGTVTDIDGNFSISVENIPSDLEVSFLGYSSEKLQATSANVGNIQLKTDSKALDDVVVKSSIAVARKTPVALSSIDPIIIEEKLGNQEFPELLNSTPGVYATKKGGGFGDSEINMRGFKSANVAVMINGVPVNDMEWGGVYWSNWAGLSDVTRQMQTQRGLGASKVSAPSVGGTINVVTKSIDAKRGGSVSYAVGNDGYQKMLATVSTGMNDKGWALTVLLAKNWGNGYVQGTEFEAYNWFVSIAKRLNDSHQLSLTAFGAPQWHNQRSSYDGLTIVGWQQAKDYMKNDSHYKYNPTYGFGKNGERKTSSHNEYHKPQISLNHQWQINERQTLSTALYSSIGRGNGYAGQGRNNTRNDWYGANSGTLNMKYRNADGTFAYDKIQEMNEQSDQGSIMVMSKNKNYHTWLGLLSNYNHEVNDDLTISGGIDFRWYKGVHTNELIDLYNGAYYIDEDSRKNVKAANNYKANDPNFKTEKLHVGDVVYRDYDGYTVQGGAFAQAEYTLDDFNFFLSGSLSNTTYWRYDRFYYDDSHAESEHVNFWGYTVKGGANYNLNEYNNVFFNAGYISRAPFFSGGAFLSAQVSNATNPDAVNEKIVSFEAGYGFNNDILKLDLNAYFTKWMDKTMTKTGDFTLADGTTDRWNINMEGVDARHMGVELDLKARPAEWVEMNGMLSLGNWIWDCNTTGYFYDSMGQPLADSKGTVASGAKAADHAKSVIELDKVRVGGSAQTTAALGIKFKPMKGLRLGIDYNLFARNYADWEVKGSDIEWGGTKTFKDPWRIPSGHKFSANAGYSFKLCDKLNASFSGNVDNLFNNEYIVNATDGANHDWKSAYSIFYNFGRTYSVKFKVSF
ncbi:MAG: carboxypeptidase-like regulatory domain-containing protein [Bacteroidales bacterium]|nr:carboxypeptidase-like regulatory domain-containing protein [Bacteroidales bacterium]